MTEAKVSRREQILHTLMQMLEEQSLSRITTAALAREVGVSEAALYRHFASKAKMFEGLIDFIEDTLFTRTKLIQQQELTALQQCQQMLTLLLTLVERNPGLCRLLTGEALLGENPHPYPYPYQCPFPFPYLFLSTLKPWKRYRVCS